MKRLMRLAVIMLCGLVWSMPADRVWAQAGEKDDAFGFSNSFSYSYTPLYQFETDLDNGGSFDVSRHYLRFGFMRFLNQTLRMGVGLKYDFEFWNFSGLSNVAGASPWDTIHSPGANLPVFYPFVNDWTLGFVPAVEFSGESGADAGDGFTFGGVVSLAHRFGRKLYLGLGVGVFDQLEEMSVFPFVVINWQITEKLRISNPFQAGPAGPAGLELVFAPAPKWEVSAGGAYRSYRFKLNDDSAVPEGIGENEFLATFLRVQRKLAGAFMLDLVGGALFDGRLSIEDSDGDRVASERYNPAPVVALTVRGKF